MSPRLLIIATLLFFWGWREAADSFLLFCALFSAGLWVCVLIYRMEHADISIDEE